MIRIMSCIDDQYNDDKTTILWYKTNHIYKCSYYIMFGIEIIFKMDNKNAFERVSKAF